MPITEEEKVTERIQDAVYGQKYNFSVVIDPSTKCGLKGLPPKIEKKLLSIFSKQEIMEDPDKVIQCILEARVLQTQTSD